MTEAGFSFEVRVHPVEEDYPDDLPKREIGIYLARKKNNANKAFLQKGEVLLTSDTTVIVGNESLEKAEDHEEAREMLEKLSGQWHEVISGVCIASEDKTVAFDVTTRVKMFPLKAAEIDYYIRQFQPYDKAGAYGIQDWFGLVGIEGIQGSFYNVVGLPIAEVYRTLIGEFDIHPQGASGL